MVHKETIQILVELNTNPVELYRHTCGDAETFWMACVIANKPFYMNPIYGFNALLDKSKPYCANKNVILTHVYKDHILFSQKGFPHKDIPYNIEIACMKV